MTKIRLPEEIAYLLGILCMAIGVACVSASNFGYSMIVAPAYLLFAKLGGLISFGTAEYLFQGLLLVVMCLCVRKFRIQYLFSFVTAVVYGYTFDLMLWLVGHVPSDGLAARIVLFAVGTGFISISVALFVRTYLAPEVYELFVRELAVNYSIPFGRVKLTYDCISCAGSIVLSVILFGGGVFTDFSFTALGDAIVSGYVLEGIGIGTVVSMICIGRVIAVFEHFCKDKLLRLSGMQQTAK